VSVSVPYSCIFGKICCALADLGSLFFMYRICSRNLDARFLLVLVLRTQNVNNKNSYYII
jgi:hypothetical protein